MVLKGSYGGTKWRGIPFHSTVLHCIFSAGHLLSHVSWTCPQSNPDIRVSGYKVLVDGKQYGTTLHAGIQNVRIKVSFETFHKNGF